MTIAATADRLLRQRLNYADDEDAVQAAGVLKQPTTTATQPTTRVPRWSTKKGVLFD